VGKPFMELQQTFIFLELTEAFYTLLRISTITTLFVILPFMIYHIWSFFIPSFYKSEREHMFFILLICCIAVISEIALIYFIVLPQICSFLMSFEITSQSCQSVLNGQPLIRVEFTARIESVVGLLVKISALLLSIFQIPLCVFFMYSKKMLHVSFFYFNRKLCSIFLLLVSAFVAPPDVISQLVVAVIFFIVLEFLIFIGLLFE
jgi:sec-independent protein translocase protein TatC